jgi:hypothetical protein
VTVAAGIHKANERLTLLDTHVRYRLVVDGHPLIGPGAQIQMSFDADGEVTRLIHATPALEPGESVAIVDPEEIRCRVCCSVIHGWWYIKGVAQPSTSRDDRPSWQRYSAPRSI